MIPRRRLLATTLLAAAAAGLPVRAAAQPGLPADPDGTIPAPLTARGGTGRLEPGFPIGHVAVSGSGGNVRFRTAAGWGPWQPVVAGCTARTDRAAALLPAGGAFGVALTRVDPQARVHYVNPINNATRDVDAIAGHRDWLATECPGNAFAPTLPDLRREVAALLRPGVPRP
jgi:hypothetical protein